MLPCTMFTFTILYKGELYLLILLIISYYLRNREYKIHLSLK